MPNGYPINWALPAGSKLPKHPMYIKYSSSTFAAINPADVKQDLDGIMATAGNAEIVAYLSWLSRVIAL